MNASYQNPSTGIGSYDQAQWSGWLPEQKYVVVQPNLSCLLQQVPVGHGLKEEAIVPPHPTHHILLFWTQGVQRLNYQLDEGRRCARLSQWEGLHIPPGQQSWWESTAQSAQGLFHVHLDDDVFEQARLDLSGQGDCSRPDQSRRLIDSRLQSIAAMMLAAAQADLLPPKLLWDSYSVLLAHALLNSIGEPAHLVRGGLAPWQVRRCTDFLHEHAAENVGLEQLAALIGLSPFHFARAFKHSTGLPPHRYQLNLRIAHAKALLEETDAPVTDIAFKVGYESSQALARLFRREVGMSPSDYRRMSRI